MRKLWRLFLPVIGLSLFGAVTYRSYESQRTVTKDWQTTPRKYLWWSMIELDSNPSDKLDPHHEARQENSYMLSMMEITSGLLDKILVFSALPAFIVGLFVVVVLGNLLGISQVSSFMALMPVLIFAWYYFVGWLLERWIRKR
jgi:hypothetical protein